MESPIHLISLGAGVQSSTMALMAACGELTPMPMAAIFADTQDEPEEVYRWLDWLETELPFPVYRVTKGRLSDASLKMRISKKGRKYSTTNIPFFTLSADGELGKIKHRSCTADFKIKPIMKHARKLGGIKRGQKTVGVIQWIGISTDEIIRMKPSRDPWAESRWPLIEKRMSRLSCLTWMAMHGYPTPPRSACVYCPFRNNAEWRRMQLESPDDFARAVQFEQDIQAAKKNSDNFDSTPFIHRSCTPLHQIDFRTDVEHGQREFAFQDECTGMCGT